MPAKKQLKTQTLYLIGDIEDDNLRDFLLALDEANADEEIGQILIKLSSEGGSTNAALAIYWLIVHNSKPIDILVIAMCGSSANMILQAARRRLSLPFARFMNHETSVTFREDEVIKHYELLKMANHYEKEQLIEDKLFAERIGMPVEDFRELISKDLYLTAEEALKVGTNGWIDEIITEPI